tara:strand:+ start:2659 stop:3312 length:654 start_codon:yes stop_codon:yes gene_type:complete
LILSSLTARQEECLRLTTFRTDKEIAAELGLSEATVKKHVHAACQRLGVNRRKAALALLEPKVPTATKDPMDEFPGPALDASTPTEIHHAPDDTTPAALDLGRPGNGPRSVRSDTPARDAAQPLAGRPALGRELDDTAGPAGPGAEHGLGPGSGRRLGYRPPPGGWALRLLIIGLIIVFGTVMLVGVFEMLVRYQHQVSEIDLSVTQATHPIDPASP